MLGRVKHQTNPEGRITSPVNCPLHTRHATFLILATLESGEMRPGSAQQTSRARVVKGGNQPPPNISNVPKRSQRISTPFKKGEGGRGQKKEKTQPSKAPWRRFTQPPSNVAQVHEQPHLAELMRSNKMVTRTSNQLVGTSHCKQNPVCCTLAYTSPVS